ncbi:MAG: winged helix-turn-helix domain-containing protein [Endomicrobia bacterium]|nr:winged helix-turn-helix domain-containing protein [Endomicrobiia bacterium]
MNEKIKEIGINAGKIWSFLTSKSDYIDILEIKFSLSLNNTDLFLALGWLAREDKLDILISNDILKVKLK